ncbi:hypothetical protein AKJ65_03065 [candidate division MSBL1 archaeon SCGC-AAA259E19]|uniref:DUF357 domain-containing protein n=1 Tax=candidate division MSBL1 archaeon SCGC-AAA259E19 TaxID=1698264 RepID=A0A133ULA4_9EURY|nr:hypothetical protein AKJ65_03065 [candidate division MSBL1 archaeon SCGC-AAA259E19]
MLKNELLREIEKWTEKLEERLPKLKPVDDSGKELLENARAYRRDSEHFLENDRLIESYESLIWAWAYVDIGERLDHLERSRDQSRE